MHDSRSDAYSSFSSPLKRQIRFAQRLSWGIQPVKSSSLLFWIKRLILCHSKRHFVTSVTRGGGVFLSDPVSG